MKKQLFFILSLSLFIVTSCKVTSFNDTPKGKVVKEEIFKVTIPVNYGSKEYFDSIYKKGADNIIYFTKNDYFLSKNNKLPKKLTSGNYIFKLIPIVKNCNEKFVRNLMTKDSSLFVGKEGLRVLFETIDINKTISLWDKIITLNSDPLSYKNRATLFKFYENGKAVKFLLYERKFNEIINNKIIYVLVIKKIN